jgi:hypothetical protein
MLMTIYRYELENGVGPYRGATSDDYWANREPWPGWKNLVDAHNGDSQHPTWITDGIRAGNRAAWSSGSSSLKLIMRWFEGFHEELRAAGFQLMRYRIPDSRVEVGDSGLQVAFFKGGRHGVPVKPWFSR